MLLTLIKEVLAEEDMLDEKSNAAQKAKQQGLTYMSFGRWGKDGTVTHTTQNGTLVPVKPGTPPPAGSKAPSPGAPKASLAQKPTPAVRKPTAKVAQSGPVAAPGKPPTTDAEIKNSGDTAVKVVDGIQKKLNKFFRKLKYDDEYEEGTSYPIDDFCAATKLTPHEVIAYDSIAKAANKGAHYSETSDGFAEMISYDPKKKTVTVESKTDSSGYGYSKNEWKHDLANGYQAGLRHAAKLAAKQATKKPAAKGSTPSLKQLQAHWRKTHPTA